MEKPHIGSVLKVATPATTLPLLNGARFRISGKSIHRHMISKSESPNHQQIYRVHYRKQVSPARYERPPCPKCGHSNNSLTEPADFHFPHEGVVEQVEWKLTPLEGESMRQGRSPQASWWGDMPQKKLPPPNRPSHKPLGLFVRLSPREARPSGFPLGKPDRQGGSGSSSLDSAGRVKPSFIRPFSTIPKRIMRSGLKA